MARADHNLAQQTAQHPIDTLGEHLQAPHWSADDYDSLYVVRLKWQNGKPVSANFKIEAEGLNHQSVDGPGGHA